MQSRHVSGRLPLAVYRGKVLRAGDECCSQMNNKSFPAIFSSTSTKVSLNKISSLISAVLKLYALLVCSDCDSTEMVKIVVVLHLGNALARTAFQEFEFRMHYIPTFDLIVTVNDSVRDTQFIRRSNGVVKIVRVENIGADLGAFFQILHLLKDYEVVLKLHSKSFRGERRLHFKRLLASSQSVANIISKLKKGDFGMYAAKKLRVEGYDFSLLQV